MPTPSLQPLSPFSPPPSPIFSLGTRSFFLLTYFNCLWKHTFFLKIGFSFSNYAMTIVPCFLFSCISFSPKWLRTAWQMVKGMALLPLANPSLSWQVWLRRSIILWGGRQEARAVNSTDLWPTFSSQKLIIQNLCWDKTWCKSAMKALCRQKGVILQVSEHMLHLFDLYGHPRAFMGAKKWKPNIHCKQMVLLTRRVRNSSLHSPNGDLKQIQF